MQRLLIVSLILSRRLSVQQKFTQLEVDQGIALLLFWAPNSLWEIPKADPPLIQSLLLVLESYIPAQQLHSTLINYLAYCPRDFSDSQARLSPILGDFSCSIWNCFQKLLLNCQLLISAGFLFQLNPICFIHLRNSPIILAL